MCEQILCYYIKIVAKAKRSENLILDIQLIYISLEVFNFVLC